MTYEPVIGLEVHAELQTKSKMFCKCQVVDSTAGEPNRFVCPVCIGMPGMLPVINKSAVEFGIMAALVLNCTVAPINVFARKNYFYPDLPKGYQISQYEMPLAVNGYLTVDSLGGQRRIGIRRIHLEEDTGKLFHGKTGDSSPSSSLVDFNRSGVPLLEIVSEPDMRSIAEVESYAKSLRKILRYLDVNSGDMEKGVIRFEANVSVREYGSDKLNTRTEIKNLNSFKALVGGVEHELRRQSNIYASGGTVEQETLGWNDNRGETVSQRTKEHVHDYRYFPDPDLPQLQIESEWVEEIRTRIPEMPDVKHVRFSNMGLTDYDANILTAERTVSDYFDRVIEAGAGTDPPLTAKTIANWITSQLFGLMNAIGIDIEAVQVKPEQLAELISMVESGKINSLSGKRVLKKMVETGESPTVIVDADGLHQVSDKLQIVQAIEEILDQNPLQVAQYVGGKETVSNWLFGQVMRKMSGKASSHIVKDELDAALVDLQSKSGT